MCGAGSRQAGAGAGTSPFLPRKAGMDQHHLGQKTLGALSPAMREGDEKFSLSFALYRLKRKRLPEEIIFTPLNTTRQIYILSLFDSKDVLLPYFFWNGNSIMCG